MLLGSRRSVCLDPYTEDYVAATVGPIDHVCPSLKAGGGGGGGSKEALGLASAQPRFYIHPYTVNSTTTCGGVVFAEPYGKFVVGVHKKRQDDAGSEGERTVIHGRILRGSLEISSQLHVGNLL